MLVFRSILIKIKPHNDNIFKPFFPSPSTFISHIGASLDHIKQTIRSSSTSWWSSPPYIVLGLSQYHGLKLLWTNTLDQLPWTKKNFEPNFGFPWYMHFSFYERACVHIWSFFLVNLCVYTTWIRWTCAYPSFFILWSLICNFFCCTMIFYLSELPSRMTPVS